jgi:5-methylcytosine-specific restriction endonuclease McrA
MVWHPLYAQGELSTEERRQRREAMLPQEWTWNVWDKAREHWGYRCAACGNLAEHLQRDHLIPLAHRDCPGAVPSNLLPLCVSCNKDKSAQDFATWYERHFRRPADSQIDRIHAWQWYCLKRGWH